MYKIVFPIPLISHDSSSVSMPNGLARDILSQLKFEPEVRIICPHVISDHSPDGYVRINLKQHDGLSWRLLPWRGGNREFWLRLPQIIAILIEEAKTAAVWHSGCTIRIWDITNLSYVIGRRYSPGIKVLALDSDPGEMLEKSDGAASKWIARLVKARYLDWAQEADATIMVGAGVVKRYGAKAKYPIQTNAVWLTRDDLAQLDQVSSKFKSLDSVKMILPSRLLPWKGVNDVIAALDTLREEFSNWELTIMGEGTDLETLRKMAAPFGKKIVFRGVVPYGFEFFSIMREHHIAIIPTRATEEARIAYDAAASGCVIINSRTITLESALQSVTTRFSFEPGNVLALAEAFKAAVANAENWGSAAVQGVEAMTGRTIDEMHRVRVRMLGPLRKVAPPLTQ